MKNKKALLVIIILIVVVTTMLVYNNYSKKEEVFQIGGMFSLTGEWQHGGGTEARFAQIAIDEINELGGINGKKVEFILEDVKSNPSEAATVANKLISVNGLKFILGPDNTPNFQSSISIIDTNNVFSMAVTVTAKNILDNLNYAVRLSPDSIDAGNLIGELAVKKYNLKKIAILIENSDFDRSWADDMKIALEKEGGKVLLYEVYNPKEPDFRTPLLKISKEDVDGLYFSGRSQVNMGNAIKQMKELNILDETLLFGNTMIIDPEVYKASGNSLPSTAFSIEVYSENEELLNKYVSKYNEQPGFIFFYSAAIYDGVYMLKEAIEFCQESPSCVKDYFSNKIDNFKGKIATWSFNDFGDPILPITSYKEVRIIEGKKVYEDLQ